MQPTTTAAWRAFAALAFVFVLTACGGGGGGDGGGGGGAATPTPASGGGATPTPGSKLFVSDGGNHVIASLSNSNPAPGTTFAIDRIIGGPATGFGSGGTPSPSAIPSMALDVAADQLYVSTQTTVGVFNQASFAAGNVAPARTFTSAGVNFFGLSLDTANNRLYVADINGSVQVFDNPSGLSGPVTPSRTIQINLGATISGSFGIAVDTTTDKLFVGVLGSGFTHILVFNSQSTLTGSRAPDQTLSFSTAPTSFYLDSVHNRLYVAVFGGDIQVFDNANSLTTGTGPLTPARTIPLSTASTNDKFIFVDTVNDRLYAVGTNLFFIVPNASLVNGAGIPVTQGTLQDPNARFSAVVAKP